MRTHLQSFQLKLRLLGPVFIGSGTEINKKEYLFIPQTKKVCIPNLAKLTALLDKKGLLQDYMRFMLSPENDLYNWLKSVNIKYESFSEFISYEMSAGDALDANHSLKGIQLFIKDRYGFPYIPGSSLKGAVRTALLSKMLSERKQYSDRKIAELNKVILNIKQLNDVAEGIESDLLHKLNLYEKSHSDAVNSIMKGIQISDSAPIDTSALVLCRKIDIRRDGTPKSINTCRECLKPGTEVFFTVTLDEGILNESGINKDYIRQAIAVCAAIQFKQYSKYSLPHAADKTKTESGCEIYIGGGAGFLSKTFIYALDEDKGLRLTAKILDKQFSKHYHSTDESKGVSPHTMKCTSYNGKLYPFGRCEVIF
jgi:CRISPR-associated protein Csm5